MGELREHRSLPRIEPTSFGRDYHLVKAGIPETERERYLISINEIAAFYRRKKRETSFALLSQSRGGFFVRSACAITWR